MVKIPHFNSIEIRWDATLPAGVHDESKGALSEPFKPCSVSPRPLYFSTYFQNGYGRVVSEFGFPCRVKSTEGEISIQPLLPPFRSSLTLNGGSGNYFRLISASLVNYVGAVLREPWSCRVSRVAYDSFSTKLYSM